MNALYKGLGILITVSLLLSGCAGLPSRAREDKQPESNPVIYESILGRSLADSLVVEFIADHNCSTADQFLLCKSVGMALWTDTDQVVETVYLYVNNTDGFAAYNGELPFGLKFYDNLAAVEYKLDRQGVAIAGLPDLIAVPDHVHYRATYHQAGMTILYNSPFPDEDATIYAILVSQPGNRAKDAP